MKLVRSHINEKFSEKGDPVRDMGIGAASIYQKLHKDMTTKVGGNANIAVFNWLLDTPEYDVSERIHILDYMIDNKKIDIDDKYLAQIAYGSNIDDKIQEFLIDKGVQVKAKQFINELLVQYSKSNNTEKIIKLVKGGADPRMRGNKPIMLAIRHRNKKVWDVMEPYVKWK